ADEYDICQALLLFIEHDTTLTIDNPCAPLDAHSPEDVAALWEELAEYHIAMAVPQFYENAGKALKNAAHVLAHNGLTDKWEADLARIMETHKRKPKLMNILNQLEGETLAAPC
ncbi:MAG: hypothetical protein MI747_15265, partial [Desulfobacterales bacterium]|nr:hypothetical protein [Desulfobacterales bacterium]